MYLKETRGNVTLELLIFFVLIASSIWLSMGIYQTLKAQSALREISYLAARQIAINSKLENYWRDPALYQELAQKNNLKSLELFITCENSLCKNGNQIKVRAVAKSESGFFSINLENSSAAVSNKFMSD